MSNIHKSHFYLSLVLSSGLLLMMNVPIAQAEWKGCASPSETCTRLSNLLDKAMQEQNLSYCDAIVTENLSAMLKQPFSDEHVSGNPSELQGECYGMALHSAIQPDMCYGLGVRGLCAGNPSGCESYLVNLRINCFVSLAVNTRTPKYCASVPDGSFWDNPQTKASCYSRSGGLFWAAIYGSAVAAFQLKESIAFFFGILGQAFFGTAVLGRVGLYVIYLILSACIMGLTKIAYKFIMRRRTVPAIFLIIILVFVLAYSILFWMVDLG